MSIVHQLTSSRLWQAPCKGQEEERPPLPQEEEEYYLLRHRTRGTTTTATTTTMYQLSMSAHVDKLFFPMVPELIGNANDAVWRR
jgi:hypothetical protein